MQIFMCFFHHLLSSPSSSFFYPLLYDCFPISLNNSWNFYSILSIYSFCLSSSFFCKAVVSLGTLFFSNSCSLLKASRFFYFTISLEKISFITSLSFFCIVYRDSQSSMIVTVPSSSPIAAIFPPVI